MTNPPEGAEHITANLKPATQGAFGCTTELNPTNSVFFKADVREKCTATTQFYLDFTLPLSILWNHADSNLIALQPEHNTVQSEKTDQPEKSSYGDR